MPYYEFEYFRPHRKLEVGERIEVGVGHGRKSEVEIWGDDLALVTPGSSPRTVYAGNYNKSKKSLTGSLRPIDEETGRTVVERKSIGKGTRPKVIWLPK